MAVICTSMAELEAAILLEMRDAMEEVHDKSLEDLKNAIDYFYAGGTPVMYNRTGQLGDIPETTPLSGGGTSITFEAKLNNSGGYSTGVSPSMQEVLELTNDGNTADGYLRPAVGSRGYWQKAEENIENDLNSAMASHFS